MKRIFKLRGEILISAILSIIIGFVLTMFVCNVLDKNQMLRDNSLENSKKYNDEMVEKIKTLLQIDSEDKDIVSANIDKYKNSISNANTSAIYIVDNSGNVIKSGRDDGIKNFDLSNNSIHIEDKYFYVNNVLRINQDYSVIYVNNGWSENDNKSFFVCIFVIIIIFLILLRGRVKYIKVIAEKINKIALGDFNSAVPIKYKNELTELASNINTMAKDLAEMESNQKEFITNISHDLRTPLTTIVGYSKMIADKDFTSEEELNKYISVIRRKSLYLSNMINDFFDYAKISSSDMEYESIKINFNEMLNQLLYGEELNLKERNLKMSVQICEEKLYTEADPMLLGRAVQNLLGNSLKYTIENGNININLSQCNFGKSSSLLFEIYNDTAKKITDDDIEKIFKRLYKIDKSRGDKGSGLGLVITKEIIEMFNGKIKAETNGYGIKFSVILPLIE